MRLGEIKQKLDYLVNENNQIIIESKPIFEGQAHILNKYKDIIEVLEILKNQEWNDLDFTPVQTVIGNHPPRRNKIQVTQEEYNQLNTYISSLNQKLPYYFSILSTIVEDQDEKCINIKLPGNLDTFDDLNKLNKSFDDTLVLFNIDGEFSFSGFDKGTDWYIVCANGILTCQFFISCLKLAQEMLKTRAEYFKSEEARLSFEASKASVESLTRQKFDRDWEKLYLDEKIEEIIKKIGDNNGATPQETHSKLLKGTEKLIKQLGEGVEFHLSLNPPSYASEVQGSLEIDYKKIQQMRAEKAKIEGKNQQKELPKPKKEAGDNEEAK